jgi:hypothetical protein
MFSGFLYFWIELVMKWRELYLGLEGNYFGFRRRIFLLVFGLFLLRIINLKFGLFQLEYFH